MHAKRSPIRRTTALAAAVTAALVLAACGGKSDGASGHGGGHDTPTAPASTAPSGTAAHNAADTAFAQGMLPHHRQALEMASLAATRAESAEVRALADEIRKAQDPEIKTLSGWLASWGEQVPAEGGGHTGHSMSGMMTGEEMDQLTKASGKAFDTAFLQLMVKHHEGAVAMAKTEQTDGRYQPAKDMAAAIVTSQSAEITRMNGLLGKN
ncbi:uncharacterized protein (DUF305 family) [Streptomyces sp. 3211.6]|uniref:DUF305 domain-containing protein n=1 Tax=Streptomyces TaxID=1883 RepID=UPI0009A55AA6|nr:MULTISPECIES: DUF305 domain-containing protein [Streptomyces]RKT07959.1 uncharacterized protein (DUF305 family) [Streptomyces sp. 3211.6]RPF44421.1 uncharacterized protein (DUF305 family) [Streptomyces sp. Ag109_G2-6]